MEALIVVLLLALLGLAAVPVWLLLQRGQSREDDAPQRAQEFAALRTDLTQALTASQQTVLGQVNALDQRLNQRLDAVKADVSQTMTAAGETMGRVDRQLGQLGESAKRIMQVGQDVSSLKDVLQPPKLRGGFGELLLEQLVKQVLPPDRYSTQYRFRDNTIVDLVIHSPEGLVPVDSKFPVESFRRLLEAQSDEERDRARRAFVRDVKLRIEEVAKYIRPDDSTLDFALMYVPAENVYYETIAGTEDESPMTYALQRGVHLCSPNTFHAFLQVVLRGFRGLKVQEEAKEILARLDLFKREFAKFHQEFQVLGTHVGRAKNKYDDIEKITGRLTDRLEIEIPIQGSLLEPSSDERQLPGPAAQSAIPEALSANGADE